MPAQRKTNSLKKALIRRYLIWCYKTTKENLDRIDRKFTQLSVDEEILKDVNRASAVPSEIRADYEKHVVDFRVYMQNKRMEAIHSKFLVQGRGVVRPEYLYLKNRLGAIEQTIGHFLGKKELRAIQGLYEKEMTRRILEAREER